MKEGAKFCGAGIALGIGGAVAISRSLSSELHGVSPVDPITYAGVALVVALVSLVACYVPTRRAIRVDPLVTLRDQ
jgi:putative ABC transport system permease protein